MGYVAVSKEEKRNKRKKFFAKLGIFATLLVVAIVAICLNLYWKSVVPTIIDIAQTRVRSQTLLAVNCAVEKVIDEQTTANLLQIERDEKGQIVLLSANTTQVNILARQTALASQQEIEKLAKEDIQIPFGTISGIPLLMERGPDVTITVSPIGAVNCDFVSSFQSVGINQTLHRIYVNVYCEIDLIIPTARYSTKNVVPILLSETIIVGQVPATYLSGDITLGGTQN